jgi:hypothetical protein
MKSLIFASSLLLPSLGLAYTLTDTYDSTNFFSEFAAFTDVDPTDGYVTFLDMADAQSAGLYTISGSTIKLAVDSTNIQPVARPGVRMTSNKAYNEALIIADIAHMPGGICGTWPAFWTTDLTDWPTSGEIDIIEGVNSASTNQMTLHTNNPSCSIGNNAFSGTVETSNCNVAAVGQSQNAGCGIQASGDGSYGEDFNSGNGGVYAMEWTATSIKVWFFSRSSIPADITSGSPDPTTWPEPQAGFEGGCDISSTFANQKIIFDTTFCGEWAGTVWTDDPVCKTKASTCNDYVANNPADFADAYWEINSVKVYEADGTVASSPAASSPSTSAPAPADATPPPQKMATPNSTTKKHRHQRASKAKRDPEPTSA